MANDVTFTSHKEEAIKAVSEAMARALEICGGKAETYAKELAPVGTPESTGIPGYHGGTLRNSISPMNNGTRKRRSSAARWIIQNLWSLAPTR